LSLAERELVACGSGVANINCLTLANLFHERATFALRLPRAGQPMVHAKTMQLQCGGLIGLQVSLGLQEADVHVMVQQAQLRHGSLLDLPWAQIVNSLASWQGRRRAPVKEIDR
jgi:hypothetical protein